MLSGLILILFSCSKEVESSISEPQGIKRSLDSSLCDLAVITSAEDSIVCFCNGDEIHNKKKEAWRILFHPDLIRKSALAENIDSYSFFDYDLNEGLHLSEKEKRTIEEILSKIVKEYNQHIDNHSHGLIISNLHLLLDYCSRFYDRQFYTRSNINSDIISKFERVLKEYYESSQVYELGVPTDSFCAEALNLSTNYFSDLLKKETGQSAQEHIHAFVIQKAKKRLLNSSERISEISYSLGFEYSSNFSTLFKSRTGKSPLKYRKMG